MMIAAIALTLALCENVAVTAAADGPSFTVTYNAELDDTFTGPVYLMFTESRRGRPSAGPDWFNPEPFYRINVEDWKPGETLEFGPETAGYPAALDQLPDGQWRAQAVMRTDLDGASIAGQHSFVSDVVSVENGSDSSWPVAIEINTPFKARGMREIPGSRILKQRSDLLSDFHGRDIEMQAVAFFPPDFEKDPDRTWPVLYVIGGFPGGLDQAPMSQMMWRDPSGTQELVIVYLGAECGTGHHVFADSANNGPRGQALVEEFIPWLESQFPLTALPEARLLTGHSSGGWSSLWLQVTYPDFFGGTWSTAPDPVDFRAFQEVDIYQEDGNAYQQMDGSRSAVGRGQDDKPSIYLDDFCQMEEAIGDGGQIRSFEWVFSPRGEDGRPRPLFDRRTGKIDPEVAKAWEAYDISLILTRNWETLGPKLKGKVKVYMGNSDTFYLDAAARLMKERLAALDADEMIVMMPGDHSSILFGPLRGQIMKDMKAKLLLLNQ